MKQSKREYMDNAEQQYEKLRKAEKLSFKMEKQLQKIRDKGFKVIVLGSRVKVTI